MKKLDNKGWGFGIFIFFIIVFLIVLLVIALMVNDFEDGISNKKSNDISVRDYSE